jgi:hypothetical protein
VLLGQLYGDGTGAPYPCLTNGLVLVGAGIYGKLPMKLTVLVSVLAVLRTATEMATKAKRSHGQLTKENAVDWAADIKAPLSDEGDFQVKEEDTKFGTLLAECIVAQDKEVQRFDSESVDPDAALKTSTVKRMFSDKLAGPFQSTTEWGEATYTKSQKTVVFVKDIFDTLVEKNYATRVLYCKGAGPAVYVLVLQECTSANIEVTARIVRFATLSPASAPSLLHGADGDARRLADAIVPPQHGHSTGNLQRRPGQAQRVAEAKPAAVHEPREGGGLPRRV